VDSRQASLREAFDRHALTYDVRFSSLETAQAMRREIWRLFDRMFPAGGRLLDLGCGTGEDAVYLARRGFRVTAIDIAPGMIARLRTKAEALGVGWQIEARVADIESFDPETEAFDGILSDFGAVNCLRSLSSLRRVAEKALKPRGRLVLVTMGRFYPLETIVFLSKGRISRAFVRWSRNPEAEVEGVRVSLEYYSPRHLKRALGTDFTLERLRGLRSLVPSPSLEHVGKWMPLRLMRLLDACATAFRPTASMADHYVSVWRYR
jgi:ubiquinone/menaquinone biosynthesis C-methylase UbiE